MCVSSSHIKRLKKRNEKLTINLFFIIQQSVHSSEMLNQMKRTLYLKVEEEDYSEPLTIRSLSIFLYNIKTLQLNTIHYTNTNSLTAKLPWTSISPSIQLVNLNKGGICLAWLFIPSRSVSFLSQSMVLSLHAIDFLFASSIQDGCPLSGMD